MSAPNQTMFGLQPQRPLGVPPEQQERDRGPDVDWSMAGVAALIAVAIHAGLAIAIFIASSGDSSHKGSEEYVAINAGLAIKSKSTSGQKSRLPQKEVAKKSRPDAPGIVRDEKLKTPEDKTKDKDDPDPLDDLSFEEIAKKNRKDLPAGDTASTTGTGSDDVNEEGDPNGSEFGTLLKAEGDPYVGELVGRMKKNFEYPKLVDQTVEVWGCVKLDGSGKLLDRQLDPGRSEGPAPFVSAVRKALDETTDMEQPVPDHLKKQLVGKFVCTNFKSGD
jgi:hypothetical protein